MPGPFNWRDGLRSFLLLSEEEEFLGGGERVKSVGRRNIISRSSTYFQYSILLHDTRRFRIINILILTLKFHVSIIQIE